MKHFNGKTLIKLSMVFFFVVSILGCSTSIEKVTIDSKYLTLDINQEETLKITIEPSDSELELSDFHSSPSDIIKVKDFKDNQLTIQSLTKEGTATIVYKNDNLESNTVTIQVIDKQAVALAEAKKQEELEKQKAEETKKQEEAAKQKAEEDKKKEEAAKKKAEETKKAEQQNQTTNKTRSSQSSTSKKSSSSQSTPSTTKDIGGSVYIPKTGKKYHSNPNCSNMKNPTKTSLSDAKSRGYTACKKCY